MIKEQNQQIEQKRLHMEQKNIWFVKKRKLKVTHYIKTKQRKVKHELQVQISELRVQIHKL